MHATVQAEALRPTLLTDLVRASVEEAVDLRALERVRARAERERQPGGQGRAAALTARAGAQTRG